MLLQHQVFSFHIFFRIFLKKKKNEFSKKLLENKNK